jgi:cytochrome b
VANDVAQSARTVRAWDLPTRLFHWALVFCIASAWVSFQFANALADPTLRWHRWNGYAILVLVVFRVLWGFVGGSTSRFSAFLTWPWNALRYLASALSGRDKKGYLGHNPAGTWMIIVLFLAVAAQAMLGLFTLEHNELTAGPLQRLILDDERLTKLVQSLHGRGFYVLLGLIALHVAVNLIYQFVMRDKLIAAMVTGRKPAAPYHDQAEALGGGVMAALSCLIAAIVIVFGGIILAGGRIL